MHKEFTKLDKNIIDYMICCPICKGDIELLGNVVVCKECKSRYPQVKTGGELIYDFRINRPSYLMSKSSQKIANAQKLFENIDNTVLSKDNLQLYLDEIGSVEEIYTVEFHIEGSVLDVGGHQGRLRHYLSDDKVPLYISVDPFISVFHDADKPNLLQAYPCLSKPCNFLSCNAENLPFKSQLFDWVHMRSVIDHFSDPYIALKEAYRVLKPNGRLLIGTGIVGKTASSQNIIQRGKQKIKKVGALLAFKAVIRKLVSYFGPPYDDHNICFKYEDVFDLLSITGFYVEKVHRQKPPFMNALYFQAQKK